MSDPIVLAVIGGSGFYEMPGLTDVETLDIETPFGHPSDSIHTGRLGGKRVAFLARHGKGHRYLPSEIPQRANFWALKSLGVSRVLGISAVGSLRVGFDPGHFVAPDQVIDRTHGTRPETFFGEGIVAHVAMASPFCAEILQQTIAAADSTDTRVHRGGTYVVIEGPAFGTKAESNLYRNWGASVVGMTAYPEAKLAREAEMCYALLTAVTDYDSWHSGHESVDSDSVFAVMKQNVEVAQQAVAALVSKLDDAASDHDCTRALDSALVTEPAAIPADVHERLRILLARRLGGTA